MWVLFYGHADQAPGPDAVQTRVAPAPEGCGGVAAAEVGEEGRGGGRALERRLTRMATSIHGDGSGREAEVTSDRPVSSFLVRGKTY